MATMEMHDTPPAYALLNGHPSSPPMTPGTHSLPRFPPQTSHTSPIYKRMDIPALAQSPPLESIEATEQASHFGFPRPPSSEPSSRPSTASGRACATPPQDSEYETETDDDSVEEVQRPARRVEIADFILEELDSDPGYDSDLEVVRPDHFEDAQSDRGGARLEENGFIDRFDGLNCDVSADEEEQQRRYIRKKKRWSAGIYKRTYSQSIEGDSSYSDDDPLDDNDSTTRRLRRRVRGPGDRTSLIFEDQGFPNINNIMEVEESEYDGVMHSKGPPSIPSDDAFTLDELPFWNGVDDSIEIESDSS